MKTRNFKNFYLLFFLLLFVSVIDTTGQVSFKGPFFFGTLYGPEGLSVADFNNDGHLDLATNNWRLMTVSVIFGNGAGVFDAQNNFNTASGWNPWGIGSGDFNNDGNIDLAVSAGPVEIHLGDGNGNFQYKGYLQGSGQAWEIITADFNKDGNLDIACGIQSKGEIIIGLGDGSGLFPSVRYYEYICTWKIFSITAGDFNNDNILDIIATDSKSAWEDPGHRVAIILGEGSGFFGPPNYFDVGLWPCGVASADFNKDGNLDVAVANHLSDTVSLLLGEGDGTFLPQVEFCVGDPSKENRPTSLAIGDFNQDGCPDLAVSVRYTDLITILIGDGEGNFDPLVNFDAGREPWMGATKIGDFNEDGLPDIALAPHHQDQFSVLINDTIPPNEPPVALCKNVKVTAGSDCNADASIDDGSYDPDGDTITISQDPPGPYPLGDTVVTLKVEDDKGESSTCTAIVTVVDVTPATIENMNANPNVLWPPSHKMAQVMVRASVADNCDPDPSYRIISVSSNEPENGLGDGDKAPDWEITGPHTVNLRAERSGNGNGRTYTITVQCTDAAGNTSKAETTVTVPHDKKKK